MIAIEELVHVPRPGFHRRWLPCLHDHGLLTGHHELPLPDQCSAIMPYGLDSHFLHLISSAGPAHEMNGYCGTIRKNKQKRYHTKEARDILRWSPMSTLQSSIFTLPFSSCLVASPPTFALDYPRYPKHPFCPVRSCVYLFYLHHIPRLVFLSISVPFYGRCILPGGSWVLGPPPFFSSSSLYSYSCMAGFVR